MTEQKKVDRLRARLGQLIGVLPKARHDVDAHSRPEACL